MISNYAFSNFRPWRCFPVLISIYLSILCTTAFGQEPVSKGFFDNIAIDGNDTVAYHQQSALSQPSATTGVEEFVVLWKGAKWRFASKENSDAFAANPEKFSPAYNGHCANALSLGEGLIRTDGAHWEIFDNQLYLFFASRGRNRWLNS